jgi:hypothetical protein
MGWMNFAQVGASPPPPPSSEQYVPPLPEPTPDQDDPTDLLMTLMPWGIAIMFHLGVLMLAFFISWSVQTDVDEEEVIIPQARLSATPGAPLSQRQTTSLTRSSSLSTSSSSSIRRSLSSNARQSSSPSQLSSPVDLSSVSIGASAGSTSSSSDAFSDGIQGEAGMKATMYGSGGNARRLVYMIDASGSLIGTLPFVIAELKRSIGELSDRQEFTVIFFQGEEAREVPPRGLKRATQENKQRVIQWIDVGSGNIVPMNLSNPVKAITLALQYRPQLMFLLSDNITGEGRYQVDQRMLLAEIAKANRGNTKINTFQFLYPDPLTAAGLKGTMELISENSGGIYKYLDARELEIE